MPKVHAQKVQLSAISNSCQFDRDVLAAALKDIIFKFVSTYTFYIIILFLM